MQFLVVDRAWSSECVLSCQNPLNSYSFFVKRRRSPHTDGWRSASAHQKTALKMRVLNGSVVFHAHLYCGRPMQILFLENLKNCFLCETLPSTRNHRCWITSVLRTYRGWKADFDEELLQFLPFSGIGTTCHLIMGCNLLKDFISVLPLLRMEFVWTPLVVSFWSIIGSLTYVFTSNDLMIRDFIQ